MKLLILILATAALAACSKPAAENAAPPENGAQYKKDKGLALTDAMKKAIALKVAEVEEAKVVGYFFFSTGFVPAGVVSAARFLKSSRNLSKST